MMQFRYFARGSNGRPVQGRMTAASPQAVAEHLRGRSLVAVDIRKQGRISRAVAPLRHASNGSAMVVALRTLATLLGIGLPIRKALEIALQSTRSTALREGFAAVAASVEAGESLGAAMQRRDDLFSPMTVALVHAGERGGVLHETLERHAQNLEQQQALRRRLLTTMTYPTIVLVTALGLIVFLMVNVLPMFATLFDQLHVEEPVLLRLLLAVPLLCTWQFALACACGFIAAGIAGRALLRRSGGSVRLPVLSDLREKAATARFARALATLLKAGVPLPESLVCVRRVSTLAHHRIAIDRVGDALRDGNTLASAIEETRVFDGLFVHLVHVGEETGTLDLQLTRLAEWFERDFAEATTRAAALLEPLLIVGIGALVGTVVFSVFVPLYSLIGGIR